MPCFFFVILFYIFHVNQLSVKTKNSSVKNGPSMEGVVKTGNLWNKNVGKVVRNAVSLPVVNEYDVYKFNPPNPSPGLSWPRLALPWLLSHIPLEYKHFKLYLFRAHVYVAYNTIVSSSHTPAMI